MDIGPLRADSAVSLNAGRRSIIPCNTPDDSVIGFFELKGMLVQGLNGNA